MVVEGDKNRETRNRMTGQIPKRTATARFPPVLCSYRKFRSAACEFRNRALYEKRCRYWTVRLNGACGVIAVLEREASSSNTTFDLCLEFHFGSMHVMAKETAK